MLLKSIFKQASIMLKNSSCTTCKALDTKLTVTAIQSICTGQVLTHLQHRIVLSLLCNSNIACSSLKRLYLLTYLLWSQNLSIIFPPLRSANVISAGSKLRKTDLPLQERGIHSCVVTRISPSTARDSTELQSDMQEQGWLFQDKDNSNKYHILVEGIILESLLTQLESKAFASYIKELMEDLSIAITL